MSQATAPSDRDEAPVPNDVEVGTNRDARPLRMLPAVVLVILMPLASFLPSLLENGPSMMWMVSAFGPLLLSLVILLWWMLFSRATLIERLIGAVGLIVALVLTGVLADPSMRGPAFMMLTIPMGLAAFAIAGYVVRRQNAPRRALIALAVASLAMGSSTLLRAEGMWGNFASELHWRWTPSSEEQAIALRLDAKRPGNAPTSDPPIIRADFSNPQWPRFRGSGAKGWVPNLQVATNWDTEAPELRWKKTIGPGWSSFVVAGNAAYTQQQLGDEEIVSCVDVQSGDVIWTHALETRFDEAMGGPGPRATPALAGEALFVLGANGDLMRLDPLSGEKTWHISLPDQMGIKVPMWGFSSSPLIIDDNVIVHAAGGGDNGVVAFNADNGEIRWKVATGKMSYSSPQPCQFDGKSFVMMATNLGLDLIDSASGEKALAYDWPHGGYRACQPQVVGDSRILIPTGMGSGSRLIEISKDEDGTWESNEIWSTLDLKPDFNDFVVHNGHAYGFDNAIFVSIDLATGQRNWKRGRYGKGQVLLLSDCGLLLVVTEKGESVLVRATPDEHEELARMKMLDGKSWAHPVIVDDLLLLRNSRQAACYRLPTL